MAAGSASLALARRIDETVPERSFGQWALFWRRFARHRLAVWSLRVFLLVVAIAIVGPSLAPSIPTDPYLQHIHLNAPPQLWPFSIRYLMGTDSYGDSISTPLLLGLEPVLEVGVLGALMASIIGAIVGSIAGYFGRIVDALFMRVVDAMLTVPFLPLLLLVTSYLTQRSPLTFAVVFGLVGWPGVARLVRSSFLSLRQREFAEAARALGANDARVIGRHLLPNTLDVLIVATTLNVALFIIAVVSLDFLEAASGPTLSQLPLTFPFDVTGGWWYGAFGAGALLLVVLSVNFVGDGLRDALDSASDRYLDATEKRLPVEVRTASLLLRGARFALRPVGALAGSPAVARTKSVVRGTWAGIGSQGARLERFSGLDRLTARVRVAPPRWLRILPLVVAIVAVEGVVLYTHSPMLYARNFDTPRTLTIGAAPDQQFAAQPRAGGGWDLLNAGSKGNLVLRQTNAAGTTLRRTFVASSYSSSDVPALAVEGKRLLAVWTSASNSAIDAAAIPDGSVRRLTLTSGSGNAQHPQAVAAPGGFHVLFSWEKGNSSRYQTYDSFVSLAGVAHSPVKVTVGSEQDLFPHGIVDKAGALDLWYMRYLGNDVWSWDYRRFSLAGSAGAIPLGGATSLEKVTYAPPTPNGQRQQDAVPPSWTLDLARDAHGNTWAIWADDSGAQMAQWTSKGALSLPPASAPNAGIGTQQGNTTPAPLTLAVNGNREQVYVAGGALNSSNVPIDAQGYDHNGAAAAPNYERLDYLGSADESDPIAATVNGRIQVVFERNRQGSADIVTSTYLSSPRSPDLVTRLGLNIGNVWTNILIVLAGSLAGGIPFAIANAGIVIAAVVLWMILSRILAERLRWPVFMVLLSLGLIWLFNPGGFSSYIVIIRDLGPDAGWIALAGAILIAWWSGLFLFRHVEPLLRSAAVAFVAVYFLAAMHVVTLIQNEITRI